MSNIATIIQKTQNEALRRLSARISHAQTRIIDPQYFAVKKAIKKSEINRWRDVNHPHPVFEID